MVSCCMWLLIHAKEWWCKELDIGSLQYKTNGWRVACSLFQWNDWEASCTKNE